MTAFTHDKFSKIDDNVKNLISLGIWEMYEAESVHDVNVKYVILESYGTNGGKRVRHIWMFDENIDIIGHEDLVPNVYKFKKVVNFPYKKQSFP